METDPQKFASDFIVARELREAILRALTGKPSESLSSDAKTPTSCRDVLPDGRNVLLYFPHGPDYMKRVLDKSHASECSKTMSVEERSLSEDCSPNGRLLLYFVLFVGYKKISSQGQDLIEPSWKLDTGLKKDMAAIEEILSYSSCERTAGGDWTNMVIFTSLGVLDKWQESPLHASAVRDFSPKFYSKVRIHRGQIDGDFRDDGTFNLLKTLFLDFGKSDQMIDRQEKYWNTEQPQTYKPAMFKC